MAGLEGAPHVLLPTDWDTVTASWSLGSSNQGTLIHHWMWISESKRGLRRVVLVAGYQGLPCVSVVSNHPVNGESVIPSRAAKPFHVGQLVWMCWGPQSCYAQDS